MSRQVEQQRRDTPSNNYQASLVFNTPLKLLGQELVKFGREPKLLRRIPNEKLSFGNGGQLIYRYQTNQPTLKTQTQAQVTCHDGDDKTRRAPITQMTSRRGHRGSPRVATPQLSHDSQRKSRLCPQLVNEYALLHDKV